MLRELPATTTPRRRIWDILRGAAAREQRIVFAGIGFAVVSGVATAGSPILIGEGVDSILAERPSRLLGICPVMALVTAIKFLADRAHGRLVRAAGERVTHHLRCEAVLKALTLPIGYHERHGSGLLVSRLTTDADRLAVFVAGGLVQLVAALGTVMSVAVLLATTATLLSGALLLAVPPIVVVARWYLKSAPVLHRHARDAVADMLDRLSDILEARPLLQASGRAEGEMRRWADASAIAAQREQAAIQPAGIVALGLGVAMAAAITSALTIGWMLVRSGGATVGDVLAVALMLRLAIEASESLLGVITVTVSAAASLERIVALLDVPSSLPDARAPRRPVAAVHLSLDDVAFRYHQEVPLFDGLTLRLAIGQRVALVGPNGSGKSTLAMLLARMHDPQAGTVRYGDIDLREIQLRELRNLIVLVPQFCHVFDASILDNIVLGRHDVTSTQARRALDDLGILGHFTTRAGGLECVVSDTDLSQGERQLLSLARAAVSSAKVLILDEPTAHLDSDQAARAETVLTAMADDRSVISIAHREATALTADRCIALNAGRIVHDGDPRRIRSIWFSNATGTRRSNCGEVCR